jgi:hypothetical protein
MNSRKEESPCLGFTCKIGFMGWSANELVCSVYAIYEDGW